MKCIGHQVKYNLISSLQAAVAANQSPVCRSEVQAVEVVEVVEAVEAVVAAADMVAFSKPSALPVSMTAELMRMPAPRGEEQAQPR